MTLISTEALIAIVVVAFIFEPPSIYGKTYNYLDTLKRRG